MFIFIFATSGLLSWAVCRPWVEKWRQVCSPSIPGYRMSYTEYCFGEVLYDADADILGFERTTAVYACC